MNRMIVAMILLASMTACHEKKPTEFVETKIVGDVKVTWLQDNDEPRLMPRELFADAPDSLMQALNLQDGVPSSVSTFLIEKDGKRCFLMQVYLTEKRQTVWKALEFKRMTLIIFLSLMPMATISAVCLWMDRRDIQMQNCTFPR